MNSEIHVLHVDDNEAFRDLTAEFLERSTPAITVQSESNPEAVPARLDEGDVDCVVSDLEMPERTGIDLCEAVRADHPDLPFFLFTNRTGEAVVAAALAAGVTDYVRKETGAHHYDLLANRIVNAVTRHRAFARLDAADSEATFTRSGSREGSVPAGEATDGTDVADVGSGDTADADVYGDPDAAVSEHSNLQ